MSDTEIWKDYIGEIKPFIGLIRVSNQGRIYKKGTNTSKNQSGILKCTKSFYGYIRIHVSINGKVYNKAVHRLVAETFCPNPDNKPYVDHINAKRDDNRACNLRWVTSSENNKNPHYTKLLSKRVKKQLKEYNYLAESLKKPIVAKSIDGKVLYFDQIKDANDYFHTKANLNRILHKDGPITNHKSKLCGWELNYLDK